jgi:hypothetical protein
MYFKVTLIQTINRSSIVYKLRIDTQLKQSLILWTASVIIIFLAGYTERTNSPGYPVNGTTNLNYSEISYSFDTVFRGKGDYTVWIAAESRSLAGELELRDKQDTASWKIINLTRTKDILSASIPHHSPTAKVEYHIKLYDNGNTIIVPRDSNVTLMFLGLVPSQIIMFYYITLFAGLILAVRTCLEVFKEKPKIKMYSIFTLISFFSFTWIFSPVKRGCEIGMIGGTKIAPVNELFPSGSLLLFVIWVTALILVFNTRKPKLWAPVSSVLTLAVFLFGKF